MQQSWKLIRLDANHPVAAFTCGTRPGAAEIDRYLREQALIEQAARLSAVWVVEDTNANALNDAIVGFFTLSPVSVRLSPLLMERIGVHAPYLSLGGWLLGKMGVAVQHQGHGLGAPLVASAIARARALRDTTAGPLLVVDPKNEQLMHWYLGLNFGLNRLAPTDPRSLRLAMKL